MIRKTRLHPLLSNKGKVLPIVNYKMKERLVHQWRDWFLKYIDDDMYELTQKENLSSQIIKAKDDIDAENQSRLFINNAGTEKQNQLN
jgi:hypothetical protein